MESNIKQPIQEWKEDLQTHSHYLINILPSPSLETKSSFYSSIQYLIFFWSFMKIYKMATIKITQLWVIHEQEGSPSQKKCN